MEFPESRVPLVVGITGHRDLRAQDLAQLEAEVGTVFDRLKSDFLRDETDTPIVLLSALAEGADQLVARVALARGLRLIAPLPLPPGEYRRDFEPGLNAGAAEQFDELLTKASGAPVMPFAPGNSLAAVRADADKRAEQYRAVGLFIVENCDVLLALWDGNDREAAVGGTAELVAFKRRGIPFSISKSANASLDGAEIGPVIHVVTPRRKAGSPADHVAVHPWGKAIAAGGEPHARSKKTGAPADPDREIELWGAFATLTALTHDFNAEMMALMSSDSGARSVEASVDQLFTDPIDGRLESAMRQAAARVAPEWCRVYGAADTLAQTRQRQFKRDWLTLFGLGFMAFALFALLNAFDHAANVLAIGYAVAVALIFVVYAKTKMRNNQERFLDYRALAEALRAGIFLNVLGLFRQPDERASSEKGAPATGSIADSYPIKQPNELAWVKLCLRKLEHLRSANVPPAVNREDVAMYAAARRVWVYGQYCYFRDQSLNHSQRARVLETLAFISIGATWIFLVPLIFPRLDVAELMKFRVHDICIVAAGILPGLAAALTSYSERLALQAQARQYDRMRSLYERAYELLPERIDAGARHLAEAIYWALGSEAMKETADWVATYRQRPVKPLQ